MVDNPRSCPDYEYRKRLYDLLVRGGCISVIGESEGERADGDRIMQLAKKMIIECNRGCVASKCRNINECTSVIEEKSPLKLPKGFLSLNRPDITPRTLGDSASAMIKRAFGRA